MSTWNTCKPTRITDKLYLGCLTSANTARAGTYALCISVGDFELNTQGLFQETLVLPEAQDYSGYDIAQHFDAVNAKIDETDGKVLLHCMMGISRSATLAVAYLMSHSETHSLIEALDSIMDARPQVLPNSGFLQQLRAYEESFNGLRGPRELLRPIPPAHTDQQQ